MNTIKPLLASLVSIAVWLAFSFFYHPILSLVFLAALLGLILSALTTWSARRFGNGTKAVAKTAIVALVAAFIYVQTLDILYVLFSAPAGGRYQEPLEIALFAALMLLSALPIARFLPGQQQDEDPERQ